MLTLKGAVCIDAPLEQTWAVLSDLERISDWSEEIQTAVCVSQQKRGVGAQRECLLSNNITIEEQIIAWQEGQSFTYEAHNIPLVAKAKNTWRVAEQQGKTLLSTESEIVMQGGLLGVICLQPLMYLMARLMGGKTLAALKYLVEQGQPYQGKYSSLPPVSVIC